MNESDSTNGVSVTLTIDDLVRTILYGDKKIDNDFDFNSNIYFLAFFVVFHHEICVFIIFSYFFFDEVSNFRNRILTYQKRESVVFMFTTKLPSLFTTGYTRKYRAVVEDFKPVKLQQLYEIFH